MSLLLIAGVIFTAVAAQCVGQSGCVYSIEPTPRLVEHLRLSARKLAAAKVEVMSAALAGSPGRAKFAFAAPGTTLVSQSLASSNGVPSGTSELKEVELITLPMIAAHLGAGVMPALVKLDVEGVEAEVLRSAPRAWMEADGPLWVVECHPVALQRFGAVVSDIFEQFSPAAFDQFLIGKYAAADGGDLPPVSLDARNLPAASFFNLIAIPRGEASRDRRAAIERLLQCNEHAGR